MARRPAGSRRHHGQRNNTVYLVVPEPVLHRIALEPARARALVDALAVGGPGANRTMDDVLAAVDAAGGEPFETTKEFRALRRAGLAAV